MTTRNKATPEDNELNDINGLPRMRTVAQLSEAGFGSRGLIYKILKEPDGPAYVKLGKKTLIDESEWIRYLKSKTVTREAVGQEEADTANAARDATEVKESAKPEAADTRTKLRVGRPSKRAESVA